MTRAGAAGAVMRRALPGVVLALSLCAPSGVLRAQTAADPLAALDAGQRRAVIAFLERQAVPHEGGAQANEVVQADVDGDGRPDVVVLWTFLGPTFWHSHVAVFVGSGATWRERGQVNVVGMPQKLSTEGRVIRIDTLRQGPKDPRCCPTVQAVQRVRWVAGRLVAIKS